MEGMSMCALSGLVCGHQLKTNDIITNQQKKIGANMLNITRRDRIIHKISVNGTANAAVNSTRNCEVKYLEWIPNN